MADKRPLFHAKIGRFLAELREARGWSQGQAVIHAKGKIKIGTLKSLEAGRVKHPDAADLRILALAYGVQYEVLAQRFIEANYGRDLVRQGQDQSSGLPIDIGGPHGVVGNAAETRVQQLEQANSVLRSAIAQIADVAGDILQIAAEHRTAEAIGRVDQPEPGARRRARHAR